MGLDVAGRPGTQDLVRTRLGNLSGLDALLIEQKIFWFVYIG